MGWADPVINFATRFAQGVPASLVKSETNSSIRENLGDTEAKPNLALAALRSSSTITVAEKLWNAATTGDVSKIKTATFAADTVKAGLEIVSLAGITAAVIAGSPAVGVGALALAAVVSVGVNGAITTAGAVGDKPEVQAAVGSALDKAGTLAAATASTAKEYASYVAENTVSAVVNTGTQLASAAADQVVQAAQTKIVEPVADAVRAAIPNITSMRM